MVMTMTMTTVALTAALTGVASPAMAAGVNELPQVTQKELTDSVSEIDLQIHDIQIQDSIHDVEQVSQQGSETVVTLTTDILFTSGKATFDPSDTAKIVTLVAKVPVGGALSVDGHTDNVGSNESNLTLSKERAAAVAAVFATARPDIRLTVRGLGEDKPVASNGTGSKDDPAGRAKNRRVELRYKG